MKKRAEPKKIPETCSTINTVRSFCDCMEAAEPIDPAAKGFCDRVKNGDLKVTGDDLGELKKALQDLEKH